MKKLLLMVAVACLSLYLSANSFNAQLQDFKQADKCVADKVAEGVARAEIVIDGGSCYVR